MPGGAGPLTGRFRDPTLPGHPFHPSGAFMVRRVVFPGWALGVVLLLGCVQPEVAAAKFHTFTAETLAFLQDGQTTREALLLHFGTPAARFEGDRLLTYDFVRGPGGAWQRVGATTTSDWRYGVLPSTCSLVLVFRPDGVLTRHALVKDREEPPAPSTPEPLGVP